MRLLLMSWLLEVCCLISKCLKIFYYWFLIYIIIWEHALYNFVFVKVYYITPRIWSILVNIPIAIEKNMYSSVLGWNAL